MSKIKKSITDWTLSSQYPTHWGAALTAAVVTSVLREGESGNRERWCDFLTEAIEGDPHAHSVLKKCYSSIVNRDFELIPAKSDDQSESETAADLAREIDRLIHKIQDYKSSLFQLAWGHFTGASALESMWSNENGYWGIEKFNLIPSRNINFDNNFNPYWAQSGSYGQGKLFKDYPGKFVVYLPVVNGELPHREGLGRIIAYWLAFKRWVVRDFMAYCERFGKPTPIVTHKTGSERADEDAVSLANDIVEGIGRGTQPGASIPDTLKVDFTNASETRSGGSDSTVHCSLIALVNSEISKAVLGNTLTTEVGSTGGNRSLGEQHYREQMVILRAISDQLDGVINRDVVSWLVRLNFGDEYLKLAPTYRTKFDSEDDLKSAADILKILVDVGLPLPTSDVYEKFGYRAPDDGEDVLRIGKSQDPAQDFEPIDLEEEKEEEEAI